MGEKRAALSAVPGSIGQGANSGGQGSYLRGDDNSRSEKREKQYNQHPNDAQSSLRGSKPCRSVDLGIHGESWKGDCSRLESDKC